MEPLGIAAILTFGQLIKAAQLKVEMSSIFFFQVVQHESFGSKGQASAQLVQNSQPTISLLTHVA